MEKVLDIISNPIVWGIVVLIAGFIFKTKLSTYLKLLSHIIDIIEVYDDEINDVLTDEQRQKLTKIKVSIAEKVGCGKERAVLDKILDNKGYLAKGVQENAKS